MTLDEFFEELSKTRETRKWRVTKDGKVRCQNNKCPIAAVGGGNNLDYYITAKKLGLLLDDTDTIVAAADGHGYFYTESRRQRLLAVVGLQTVSEA